MEIIMDNIFVLTILMKETGEDNNDNLATQST